MVQQFYWGKKSLCLNNCNSWKDTNRIPDSNSELDVFKNNTNLETAAIPVFVSIYTLETDVLQTIDLLLGFFVMKVLLMEEFFSIYILLMVMLHLWITHSHKKYIFP